MAILKFALSSYVHVNIRRVRVLIRDFRENDGEDGVDGWTPYNKDIQLVENIPRRATKILPQLMEKTYICMKRDSEC